MVDRYREELKNKQRDLVIKQKELDMKQKDYEIVEKEMLMAKGLLTARGILETALKKVKREIGANTITEAAKEVDLNVRGENLHAPTSHNLKKLRDFSIECKCRSLKQLLSKLSDSIHSFKWSGPGVLVYQDRISEDEFCLITKLAYDLKLFVVPKEGLDFDSSED